VYSGEQGVVYAAPSEGDQPSTIYYRPYSSWASSADWTIPLLAGEDAVLVAAGGGGGDALASVIVVTSTGYVRFLSSSGIQRYIWRLGEEGVGIAAGKNSVIIAHREGGTSLDGELILWALLLLLSQLTPNRLPESPLYPYRPGHVRHSPRITYTLTSQNDVDMAGLYARRRTCNVRFVWPFVRSGSLQTTGTREMGSTGGYESDE
jgi:hypothetical protein